MASMVALRRRVVPSIRFLATVAEEAGAAKVRGSQLRAAQEAFATADQVLGGRFTSSAVFRQQTDALLAAPHLSSLLPEVWRSMLRQGCAVPAVAFQVERFAAAGNLMGTLVAVHGLREAKHRISMDTWRLVFETAASAPFDPTARTALSAALGMFTTDFSAATWPLGLVPHLLESLSCFRLHSEFASVLQTLVAVQPHCLTPDVAAVVVAAVARRSPGGPPVEGSPSPVVRTMSLLRRRGVAVSPGLRLAALRGLLSGQPSTFTRRRQAEKGHLVPTTATLHMPTVRDLVVAVVQDEAATDADVLAALSAHSQLCLRAGHHEEAVSVLADVVARGWRPPTKLLNAFLLDAAGREPAAATQVLHLMAACGVTPDETTLLTAVKCHLYASTGLGASKFIQASSAALDVLPTHRVFGAAAFYAAKHQEWEEVDALVDAAVEGYGMSPDARWIAKLRVFRRSHASTS